MGRRAEGWKPLIRNGYLCIRFTHQGSRHTISTGLADSPAARDEANRLHSDFIKGRSSRVAAFRTSRAPLEETLGEWLASVYLTHDKTTAVTYEMYSRTHWLPFFRSFSDITPARIHAYTLLRLTKVLRKTVRKERSALHTFLLWAHSQDLCDAFDMPKMPPKLAGVRSGPQRAVAPHVSEADVAALLEALPEWSTRTTKGRRFPVRARFVFMYETGLRPATIDALTWADTDLQLTALTIRDEIDKNRYGRTVDLSQRATQVLRALVDGDDGEARPIFGRHDYRGHLAAAAKLAGLKGLAAYDLRHARGTHLVDRGASLSGVAQLLGHRQVTTTNKYIRPTEKAGRLALGTGSVMDTMPSESVRRAGLEPARELPRRNLKAANTAKTPDSAHVRCLSESHETSGGIIEADHDPNGSVFLNSPLRRAFRGLSWSWFAAPSALFELTRGES